MKGGRQTRVSDTHECRAGKEYGDDILHCMNNNQQLREQRSLLKYELYYALNETPSNGVLMLHQETVNFLKNN